MVVLAQIRHGAQALGHPAMAYRHPHLVPQTTTRGATHLPLTHPRQELALVLRPPEPRSMLPRLVLTAHLHLARLMRRRRVVGRAAGAQMPHQRLVQQRPLLPERAVGITARLRLAPMVLQRRRPPVDRGTRMTTEGGRILVVVVVEVLRQGVWGSGDWFHNMAFVLACKGLSFSIGISQDPQKINNKRTRAGSGRVDCLPMEAEALHLH